jgi:hypothetical protein
MQEEVNQVNQEQEQEQPGTATLIRHCRRCHRRLKSEASMKIGYGQVCLRHITSKQAEREAAERVDMVRRM